MNLGELFDGKLHFLDPDEDFRAPWLALLPGGIVPMEVQGPRDALIESEEMGIAPTTAEPQIAGFWGVQRGWSAMSVMCQDMAACLGGKGIAAQLNHRDEEDGFAPTVGPDGGDPVEGVETEYTFQFILDPKNRGWLGGKAL